MSKYIRKGGVRLIKSYSFYSHKINKDKFDLIKNYATKIIKNKNKLSTYVYDNLRMDLFFGRISKFDFIKLTKHLRDKEIGSSFINSLKETFM